MTQPNDTGEPGTAQPGREEEEPATGPVIRDKRRIDPETGKRREGGAPDGDPQPAPAGPDPVDGGQGDGDHPDTALAAERLEEMRRMQAEFVNFRNRTQREREGDRARATASVVESLLPALDDIHSAREHGDLVDGPFATIADKVEQALGRFGVERVGAVGDVFDPQVHEALMHLPADSAGVDLPEGTTEMTVVQVMQPGFRIGELVVRAARVAVADPDPGTS